MKGSDVLNSELIKTNCIYEGDTPPPAFGTQYSEGFQTVRSTQRVGTQYAEIMLYRTQMSIFALFIKVQFSSRNTTHARDVQSQINLKKLTCKYIIFKLMF